MYLEKNLEKKWIIKSENKILGPYNFDQIADLLRKKQISIIDEVRDPETRWLYVRENNEFKNIVEEIRKDIDSKQEGTKTFQSSTSTATATSFDDIAQKTRTDINPFTDINIETKDVEVVRETAVASKVEAPPVKIEKSRIYGVQSDAVVQKKVDNYTSKLRFAIATTLVLVLSVFGGYFYFQKRTVVKQEEDLVLQLKKYKYLGLYQKAVEVYATLPEVSQRKLLPELLDTYPLLEAAGLVSFEEVKNLKSDTNITPEQRAYIELINFEMALKQQNYGQAQEFLIKATTLQPASPLIRENDALLTLKKEQYLTAYNQFKKLFNYDKNGRYLLGMVQSFMGLSDAEKSEINKELLKTIEVYTIIYFDFKKELLLAQIYLAQEGKDDSLLKMSIKQFFNTPCMLSAQFKKPILLVPNSYQWKELTSIKSRVMKGLSGDDLLLFQLHDYLEQAKLAEASDFLKNNISKVGNEQVREQMNLLLYNAQGRSREVLAVRKSNKLDMNSDLNHLVLAQNDLKIDAKRSIQDHLQFFEKKTELTFYKEWLELEQLISRNSNEELKNYLKEHFITIKNFNPVFEARNLVN